ncbi:MAG: hypothetical protein AABW58_03755 [Nanoarchaeota archaeon]
MEYETKKSSGSYFGRSSGLFNRLVTGLTGLALLASGCVDSINGVRIRAGDKPEYVKYNGDPLAPKKEEERDYKTPLIIGGVVIVAGAAAYGIYELVDDLRDDHRRRPSDNSGGGENGGGPGGQ